METITDIGSTWEDLHHFLETPEGQAWSNDHEFSFRKGYVHGVLSAIDLLDQFSDKRHLEWWYDTILLPWMYGNCNEIIEPPEPEPWGKIRKRILERDRHICRYCGAAATHVDHIVPVSSGGGYDDENLCASCADCNKKKRTKSVSLFLRERARATACSTPIHAAQGKWGSRGR